MADFSTSGRFVDLILIIVVFEAAFLVLYWKYRRRGVAPADLLPNLCAGMFLLLALRVTLAGAEWILSCACLAAAGVSHLIDVRRRWRK